MTTLIREIKQTWKPDFTKASIHVSLVIKNYSQLDKLVFHRQLDTTLRGLIVSGFTYLDGIDIILHELDLGGINHGEWLNGRTAKEIISNS